ncbi:MAG TPA: hypothetical protein VG410_10030 [Solirubrobacteraceae bacterium]|nr:hypothetical protein [Solirubrobacteraceae bacterium]
MASRRRAAPGFELEEVADRWHGVNDPLVPVEHALQLAAALPDCRVFFEADEGHHFFRRRLLEILALLVGRSEAARPRGLQLAA